MSWDPELYLKFSSERTQPAIDLATRIELTAPRRIIDLGCGPGNSTAVLRNHWPEAEITDLDSDGVMIAAARLSDSLTTWIQADAGSWQAPSSYDLVYSNALLQWLPDHQAVLTRWFSTVVPGGALAVQIPINFDAPVHRHITEVAEEPRWQRLTKGARQSLRASGLFDYYDILSPHASRIVPWITEYCHVLDDPEEIVDWMRGTGLRPFLRVLETDEDRQMFESQFQSKVARSYPKQHDGKVLFPFRRLFFIAYRKPGESRAYV